MNNKQTSSLPYSPQTLPPAQLWIGNYENALDEVERFLQTILCTNNNCNTCITCMQIREKQHHALMWFYPEKNYTIDQLEDLFTTLTYQLQPDEHFFFIIQKADFLTPTCANKLLKPMEEPPCGYHFILLAERAEQILPTIRSRCIVYTLNNVSSQHTNHPIYDCFTHKCLVPSEFSKIIDTKQLNERESVELLDTIIHYWLTIINKFNSCARPELVEGYPRALKEILQQVQDERGQKNTIDYLKTITSIITTLQHAQLKPPMPGSSIIFWRNLYLQLYKNLQRILRDI